MIPASAHQQLNTLLRLYTGSVQGGGTATLISGTVGTGKTQLLHAFCDNAAQLGASVLRAAASQSERALPLGVLHQLFRQLQLTRDNADRVTRLLDRGVLAATLHESDPESAEETMAPVLHGLCNELLAATYKSPIVVAVDDVHYADAASQQFLAHLLRRLASVSGMIVVCECGRPRAETSSFLAQLRRSPAGHAIQLDLMSGETVTETLAEYLDWPTAHRLAAECEQVSGGNPLLVRALGHDVRAVNQGGEGRLVVGKTYAAAVMHCLNRYDVELLRFARGLALLDEAATPMILARLLDLTVESVLEAMATLEEAGLLHEGRFRHEAAKGAVLDGMTAADRMTAHARAAELLIDKAPDTVVARHLIAARYAKASWAARALIDVGERALMENDLNTAFSCLRLADQAPVSHRQQVKIKSALARAEWRVDPETALRNLPALVKAAQHGHGSNDGFTVAVKHLLWHGRAQDAVALYERRAASVADHGAEHGVELQLARHWIRYSYPQFGGGLPEAGPLGSAAVSKAFSSRLTSASLLGAVLRGRTDEDTVFHMEQILLGNRLSEATLAPICTAIAGLICLDRADLAHQWCNAMRTDATNRTPAWHGLIEALMAVSSLRRGDLRAAAAHSHAALSALSAGSWGVVIGLPLSAAVLTRTSMDHLEKAADHLATPIPPAMFQTPIGLLYLYARGQYELADGRPSAALDDFRMCGRLMAEWNLDLPGLVPWRSGCAGAYRALGLGARAREAAKDQMTLLGGRRTRTWGLSVRAGAAAIPAHRRPPLLLEAVRTLEEAGDNLELAHALADLGHAYQALGKHGKAQATLHRARDLALRCGAEGLYRLLSAQLPPEEPEPRAPGPREANPGADLSDAERRVATLAARGDTNREIAGKLCITVSTVEQHLTRIYRKLNAKGRSDLPLTLPDHRESAALPPGPR